MPEKPECNYVSAFLITQTFSCNHANISTYCTFHSSFQYFTIFFRYFTLILGFTISAIFSMFRFFTYATIKPNRNCITSFPWELSSQWKENASGVEPFYKMVLLLWSKCRPTIEPPKFQIVTYIWLSITWMGSRPGPTRYSSSMHSVG